MTHTAEPQDEDASGVSPVDARAGASPPSRAAIFTRKSVGVLLVICMVVGYVAMGRQKAAKQAEAMEAVVRVGGRVYLDYQWRDGEPVPNGKPAQAAWVRRLVGDKMLDRAVAVDLRGVEQPDAVAPQMLLLPDLVHIRADNTALSDASLAIWRHKVGLTGLDLAGTGVTDSGVESLTALKQLTSLSLARTGISDRSVPVLARLPRLKHLDLSGTQLTSEALDRLRTQLPKCTVIHAGSKS